MARRWWRNRQERRSEGDSVGRVDRGQHRPVRRLRWRRYRPLPMISIFHEHCPDDECRRHRVLAGYPASIWIRAAFGFALTFGVTGGADWWTRAKAPAAVQRQTFNYMPVVFKGAGSGLGDPVVYQWPGRAWLREKPDSPWSFVVRASGAVEVHGDRNLMLREWHQDCRRNGKLYRPQDDPDLRAMPVGVWIYFPPCCYSMLATDQQPWWVDTPLPKWSVIWTGDLIVKVNGTIPESARAFWQDLARHTPTCEGR